MKLREMLEMFSGMMDAVCFREMWKAVTYGLVRFVHRLSYRAIHLLMLRIVFNDVITETTFTLRGAQQLHYDVYVLIDAFSPYTRRPHTHFKELNEACALLVLPSENALYIQQRLHEESADADFAQYLRDCQIHVLQPEQISCILEERVNY